MDRQGKGVKRNDSVVIPGIGAEPEAKVAVIGDGCFAQGLCNLVEMSFAYQRYDVVMGSIKVNKVRQFVYSPQFTGIPAGGDGTVSLAAW